VEKGITNALKKLKIESNFNTETKQYLSALFNYRNDLFHNGLEWDEKKCERFIRDYKESWFTWHARSRKLYFILPTKEFIDELIEFFADSMDSFAKSKQSLNED